jgi:hypothetical protein
MPAQEQWREIPSAPDYEASSLGRIRSYKSGRPVILKGWLSGTGYHYVTIRDGVGRHRATHSLVCEAFHGPKPFPKAEVRHLDGTRTNNDPENLCWGTASENRYDSVRHGTHHMLRRNSERAA